MSPSCHLVSEVSEASVALSVRVSSSPVDRSEPASVTVGTSATKAVSNGL